MTIKDGPLTERQTDIIERVMQGKRHREITQSSGIPVHIIKHEMANIIPKLGAKTSAQACASYATAMAYRNAAAQLLSGRVINPGPEEEHVNHVLEDLAQLFRDWADQRLPK